MSINVLIFGQLKDVTGVATCTIDEVADTDEMIKNLNRRFPGLSGMEYILAVEKEIVNENTALEDNYTVALLPPYSGG